MKEIVLKIYRRLPPVLRDRAASYHGSRLRKQRYGADTPRLVQEAMERDKWSVEEAQQWQAARLPFVLNRAATRVPYYRELWKQRRAKGDQSSWEDLGNWPILTKEELRANSRELLADDCLPEKMVHLHSSGTTGTPVHLWRSPQLDRAWYALFEARWRRPYGVSLEDRWAIIGGKTIVPAEQKKPPFWVWNSSMNQLYLSAYHLSPENAPHYLEALRKYQVKYMLGYPSGMAYLAQIAGEQNLAAPQLQVVLSNAEPLSAKQRAIIGSVFSCPVRDTYGMTEIVTAASECEQGTMHLWQDVGIVEVFADAENTPVALGETGRLICTGLMNADMPLIRYEMGDRGSVKGNSACSCGSHRPVLASIEGRLDDVIVTPDGRSIGRLDPIFKADLAIMEAQVVQETPGRLRVKVVPSPQYSAATEKDIKSKFKEYIGDMEILVEVVDALPRTANGKLRGVVNQMNAQPLNVNVS